MALLLTDLATIMVTQAALSLTGPKVALFVDNVDDMAFAAN